VAKHAKKVGQILTGRVRAADPFELIRWLARSQPDPRKALAELVQNALDAGARNVQITRIRKACRAALHVTDDGAGVIPEMERTEALRYIATHIGHSRKQGLTPDQRRELMLQGKYGIGLLGFWSIGGVLEIRSQVAGQASYLLRMFEESPKYEIEKVRGRLALDQQRTEIVVRDLHRPALASLSARRMADYLGAELRGQILAHQTRILIHDGIARGRAPKVLEVIPRRYEGERLDLPENIPVPGHSGIRVEIYLLPAGARVEGMVNVSAAGTVVYEDIAAFEVADFRREPWTHPRLHGLLEFGDFQVPPGTRRGVMPDAAAMAFAAGVRTLEPAIRERIDAVEQRAAAEVEANVLRQLERVFREVPRLAPEYEFFAVQTERARAFAGSAPGSAATGGQDGVEETTPSGLALSESGSVTEDDGPPELALAGDLASAAILPAQTRVERLGTRKLRLEAYDAAGLRITRPVEVRWRCGSPTARMESPTGRTNALVAGGEVGTVAVFARTSENGRAVDAEASVEIVDALEHGQGRRAGIPDPVFVDDPGGSWRSRMWEGVWQVNVAHPDFAIAGESARRKLRYLAALLAKEIVLHSFPGPQLGSALERLVGVLTITERGLDRS
jgi:hypothetical protein